MKKKHESNRQRYTQQCDISINTNETRQNQTRQNKAKQMYLMIFVYYMNAHRTVGIT